MSKVLADVPMVHVTADRVTESRLTMRRGAVLSGRVTFDDGAPGIGFTVRVLPMEGVDPLQSGGIMALNQLNGRGGSTVVTGRG